MGFFVMAEYLDPWVENVTTFFTPFDRVTRCDARFGDPRNPDIGRPPQTYWGCAYDADDDTPFQTPIRRDIVRVGRRAWVRLRFTFTNNGMWPFHCHVLNHAMSGLVHIFQVGPPVPPNATLRQGDCPLWTEVTKPSKCVANPAYCAAVLCHRTTNERCIRVVEQLIGFYNTRFARGPDNFGERRGPQAPRRDGLRLP